MQVTDKTCIMLMFCLRINSILESKNLKCLFSRYRARLLCLLPLFLGEIYCILVKQD